MTPSHLENVSIEFAGPADDFDSLLEEHPLARRIIRSMGLVHQADVLRLMQSAHCVLVIDAPAILSVLFPSKLVEYIGSGCSIASLSPPGASARIVTALGGIVANPADMEPVAQTLRYLLQHRPSKLTAQIDCYEQRHAAELFMGIQGDARRSAVNRANA
jgi:hypothetical protein